MFQKILPFKEFDIQICHSLDFILYLGLAFRGSGYGNNI